jgi:hypothetical protein
MLAMENPFFKSFRRPQAPIPPLPNSLLFFDTKGTPSYLVSTPKALRILLTLKLRDTRFQQLLARSACVLLAIIGFGICAFFLIPTVWAMSALAPAILLFALLLSIGTGNLFLQFALEDDRFFELATRNHALSIFAEDDQSLPQPPQ